MNHDQTRRPLVSIVLPTFNGSRFLRESIDSCLAQTYQNWELIVVDDASTDATPAIAKEYCAKDPRIRYLRNARNQKLPATLNNGFAVSKGELLTWTSDDNAYLENAIETLVASLQSHPDVAFVYANQYLIDDAGEIIGEQVTAEPEELCHISRAGACFMYRRELLETVGAYDETAFRAEDYDFFLRVMSRYPLLHLPAFLYRYRVHAGSLSGEMRAKRDGTIMFDVLARHLPRLTKFPRSQRGRGYYKVAYVALQRRDIRKFAWAFSHAVALNPTHVVQFLRRRLFPTA